MPTTARSQKQPRVLRVVRDEEIAGGGVGVPAKTAGCEGARCKGREEGGEGGAAGGEAFGGGGVVGEVRGRGGGEGGGGSRGGLGVGGEGRGGNGVAVAVAVTSYFEEVVRGWDDEHAGAHVEEGGHAAVEGLFGGG